ncbi:hypothetical protein D3C75_1179960 [compost metagenome]
MQAGFLTFVEASYAIHLGTPCTMHRVRRTGSVHAKAFHDRRNIAATVPVRWRTAQPIAESDPGGRYQLHGRSWPTAAKRAH